MGFTRERVLITGAGGFLGACLARDLLAEGHDVHLLVRGPSPNWRLAGLHGRYTPHHADLRDAPAVRAAVSAARPEVIYHAAAHGAFHGQGDRASILASNVLGTANLLDALHGRDYRVLVHTGSSSEYGHRDRPLRADDRLEPRTDYAVAKAASTLLCHAEALKGRPVVTVRIFSAYGPWEDPGRIASYVMRCCLQGVPPQVTSGRQPRDFIYVDDVIALLRAAADPALRGAVLHAGTGRPQTVRDLIETVVPLCGGGRLAARYGAEPTRADEPACWVASVEDTQARTGWRPRHDLASGVRRMWAWFTAHAAGRAA
jgi:nucleoside-diphosphate-sugar epimerase